MIRIYLLFCRAICEAVVASFPCRLFPSSFYRLLAKILAPGHLAENESTFIPIGTKHRLENPGKVPLSIIEVQSGAYLGEDDIVRFDDHYGRTRDSEV